MGLVLDERFMLVAYDNYFVRWRHPDVEPPLAAECGPFGRPGPFFVLHEVGLSWTICVVMLKTCVNDLVDSYYFK